MDRLARNIDVLLFEGVNALDVAGPVQALSSANFDGEIRYNLRFLTADGRPSVSSSCGLMLGTKDQLDATSVKNDLLVPGGSGVDVAMKDQRICDTIRSYFDASHCNRVISICSGALFLAQAGVLAGRYATTHWSRAQQAKLTFPDVTWVTDKLYHLDVDLMTSAGVTAGIDLALEVIRRDWGADVALTVARELVVYFKRTGGQNQFADLIEAQFSDNDAIRGLIGAIHEQPTRAWTLETMAKKAGLTPRTLSRRFKTATGVSPAKYLDRYRVQRATDLFHENAPVGTVISLSGFTDFQQMQRAFKRHLGTTVGAYRNKFGTFDP